MNSPYPDFYVGSPLEPTDLWYRDRFIDSLWEVLDGQHALLTAPRRTGKTSVMDHLAANPQKGFSAVTAYVQDIDHPGEFILTLLDRFRDKHPAKFRSAFEASSRAVGRLLGRLGEVEIDGFKVALKEQDPGWKTDWKARGDEMFEQMRRSGHRVLFIVDEFPDMILNIKRHHADLVRPFLTWFRGHRHSPRPRQDSLRWLLGGSVNLSSTLDAIGCLDAINDLHDEPLPALTPEEVADFVNRMLAARGVTMERGFEPEVAERLGRPIPLFMQMLTLDLYRRWKKQTEPRAPLTKADLDAAFSDLIVSSAARDKLQHYYSRIDQYYEEPKRLAAYEMLAVLSRSPDGMERASVAEVFDRVTGAQNLALPAHDRTRRFNQLLRDLENDFYVAETPGGRIDFASGLLKSWWRKYYA